MRAYVTSRGHSGVSFGVIGTIIYLFGYVLYAMALGLVVIVVGTLTLCRQLYRQYKYRNLPPLPWA